MRRIVWRGNREQMLDLLAAVARHCTCAVDAHGVRHSSCAAHRLLVEDQRALDGLLFARWLGGRLRREEHAPDVLVRDWPAYQFTPLDRSARTIEEFLAVCRAEPAVAEHHLHAGYFEPWLHDVGRPDLASLAARLRETRLEQFLRAAE